MFPWWEDPGECWDSVSQPGLSPWAFTRRAPQCFPSEIYVKQWFSAVGTLPPPQGAVDSVWRHFWQSQLGR